MEIQLYNKIVRDFVSEFSDVSRILLFFIFTFLNDDAIAKANAFSTGASLLGGGGLKSQY